MSRTTEAFSRVKIDALLKDAGWNLTDGVSVLFEHTLPDGSRADYALCDRSGRPVAVIEAKRARVNPIAAQGQGRHYAKQLCVPFVFLSNGEEVWFLDRETDANARKIATFYAPDDLERRIAARRNRLDLSRVDIDRRIVDREYQIACIEALSAEVSRLWAIDDETRQRRMTRSVFLATAARHEIEGTSPEATGNVGTRKQERDRATGVA